MMSCASCGQAIPPAESHLPCPRCGSVDRNVDLADYGAAVDEIAELDARFTPAPAAWQEMWAEVRHHLDIVRGWYSGGQSTNVIELRAASVAFFISCYHLADHIEKDTAVPQPVRGRVRRYVNDNSSLKLAADIANTHKHSERNPGLRACSITKAKIRSIGAVVTFTWTDAQGSSHHEDCLDLAERALKTPGVGWFDVDALPPLSLGRVNHRQLERALAQLPSGFDLRGCAEATASWAARVRRRARNP